MADPIEPAFNAKVLFNQAVAYPGGVHTPPSGGYYLDVAISAQPRDATLFTPAEAETMLIQYLEPVLGLDRARALLGEHPSFVTAVADAVKVRAAELRAPAAPGA